MIPRFSLVRPTTLPAAIAAMAASDGDAAYIAGGTELLQVMKMGLAPLRTLVDLKGVPDLRAIDIDDRGWLRIGGGATHREIERSPLVRQALPPLADLETHVANTRVRNCGTIGGNLAFAEPQSDPATFLLACGAELELTGGAGTRRLGVGDFVLGPLYTAREPDEIITAVHVPPRAPGEGRGYAKIAFFERPAASVAVRVRLEDGAIADAVVAAGSLTETPELVPAAADALVGAASGTGGVAEAVVAAARAMESLDAVSDLNGSADYKRHLAGVLLRRAVSDALVEAKRA
jgi:aerobic carbon-monoxide dehydrogenase medium subunit